ncbi:MAG: choice-of-anchor Q domain-containing protein [Wenzhouxiangella sp.]
MLTAISSAIRRTLALLLLLLTVSAQAAPCLVDQSAKGSNNGSSWTDAYVDLQLALGNQACAEIWVAAGSYKPTSDPTNRAATFLIGEGVSIYGGFAGGENSLVERDWTANVTVLSGDIDNNDRVDQHGRTPHYLDQVGANSHTVVTVGPGQSWASLDGLQITGGLSDRPECAQTDSQHPDLPDPIDLPQHDCFGGGILADRANLRLRNVLLIGNIAGHGGGLAQYRGAADFSRVQASGNRAYWVGGGLLLARIFATVDDNTVPGVADAVPSAFLNDIGLHGNDANAGGGLVTAGSLYRTDRLVVSSNQAERFGGGICECYNASFDGAELRPVNAPSHSNLIVSGNGSLFAGGGISTWGELKGTTRPGIQLQLYNAAITGNRAAWQGGGMDLATSVFTNYLFSSVVAGNRVGLGPSLLGDGGGINGGTLLRMHNSVVWSNANLDGSESNSSQVSNRTGIIASRSLIQGCDPDDWSDTRCPRALNADQFPGAENVRPDNPLFIAAMHPSAAPTAAGDYRLQPGSPLIDAGLDPLPFTPGQIVYDLPADDLDGNPRVAGEAITLGPFESAFNLPCPSAGAVFVRQNANGAGTGASWVDAFTQLKDALRVTPPCDIHLAEGVYYTSDFPADWSNSFHLPGGLRLLGGFPADGGSLAERDWHAHPTILSGDLGRDDVTLPNGLLESADGIQGRNSTSVVQSFHQEHLSELDGLILTGGQANRPSAEASSHLRAGGGLHAVFSRLALRNLTLQGNFAEANGGGALFSLFDERDEHDWNVDTLDLQGVRIIGNHGGNGGGLMVIGDAFVRLDTVEVLGNRGGGVQFVDRLAPPLAPIQVDLINLSVAGNDEGPALAFFNGPAERDLNIVNSIITGNSINLQSNQPAFLITRHSLIEGCNPNGDWNSGACGQNGGNNLPDIDPQFLIAPVPSNAPNSSGDLRLGRSSPAINAGDNSASTATFDLAGNPRITGGAIDLGAWEWLLVDQLFSDRFAEP